MGRKACRLKWPTLKLRRESGVRRANCRNVPPSNPQACRANACGSWAYSWSRNWRRKFGAEAIGAGKGTGIQHSLRTGTCSGTAAPARAVQSQVQIAGTQPLMSNPFPGSSEKLTRSLRFRARDERQPPVCERPSAGKPVPISVLERRPGATKLRTGLSESRSAGTKFEGIRNPSDGRERPGQAFNSSHALRD